MQQLTITEGAQDWFIYKITMDTYNTFYICLIFLIVVMHNHNKFIYQWADFNFM